MSSAQLSIIIPALNAADFLPSCLESLVAGLAPGLVREAIVVDGGSHDETPLIAEGAGCILLKTAPGRGLQLSAGAKIARGDWFLFLHADCRLEDGWEDCVSEHIARQAARGPARQQAAYFKLAFASKDPRAAFVACAASLRCAVLGLPYGDQGLLISRAHYETLGGYKSWPLFEDVDLARRIQRDGGARLQGLSVKARASARRYEGEGYAKRALKNVFLLARYYMGASPEALAKAYYKSIG